MADFTQTLGFDAGDAIRELGTLNSALTGFTTNLGNVLTSLSNFGQQATSTVAKLTQAAQAAANAAQQVNSASQQMNNAAQQLNRGSSAVGSFTLSFRQLSAAVLGVSTVVGVINQIRSAVIGAATGAEELGLRVGEIQTIDKLHRSAESLTETVRNLSNEFASPAPRVAEGLYEVLSGGIQGAQKQTEVLRASLSLANTTFTEQGATVKLVVGAINSYKDSTSSAADIAGKFFKTIELGIVRGEELASSFGRVTELGHQAGVSLEELLAAVVVMTNKGVPASQAITQLTSTLTGFLKPSQDMRSALHELGFASGDEALRILGLQGAIQAVIGTTDGSVASIQRLFRNQRALLGVLETGKGGANEFADALRQVQVAGAGTLATAQQVFQGTDAFKFKQDITEVTNALQKDLGDALVKIGVEFFKAAGGAKDLVSGVSSLIPALTVAAQLAGVLAKALSAPFRITTEFNNVLKKLEDERIKTDEKDAASQEGLSRLRQVELEQQLQAFIQAEGRKTAAANKAALDRVAVLRQQENTQLNIISATVASMERIYAAGINKVRSRVSEIASALEQNSERINKIGAEIAALDLERRNQGADPEQQAQNARFEAAKRGQEALAAIQSAVTKDQRKSAQDGIQFASQLFQKAEASAGQIQDQVVRESTINAIRAQRIAFLRDEQGALAANNGILKEQAVSEQAAALTEQQRLAAAKRLQDAMDTIRKAKESGAVEVKIEGTLIPSTDFNRVLAFQQQQLEKLVQRRIAELQKPTGNVKEDLERDLERQGLKLSLKQISVAEESLARIRNQVEALKPNIFVTATLNVKEFEKQFKTEIDVSQAGLAAARQQLAGSVINENKLAEAILGAERRASAASKSGQQITGDISAQFAANPAGLVTQRAVNSSLEVQAQIDAALKTFVGTLQTDLQTAFTNPLIGSGAVSSLRNQLNSFREGGLVQPQVIERLETALTQLEQVITLRNDSATNAEKAAQALGDLNTAAGVLPQQFQGVGEAARNAAAALNSVGRVKPQPEFFGGMMRLANGGLGTDTIPAMLSDGEMVVNARNTRRFFTQLQSINAGVQPVFRAQGGSVTNVGDVNVTVNTNTAVNGRMLANEIQREMRRGTVRF